VAGDTILTVVGNLTADPELRFTPSGAAVANFTVASTPRTFDRPKLCGNAELLWLPARTHANAVTSRAFKNAAIEFLAG
jgi:single-strand DNA-binding protein